MHVQDGINYVLCEHDAPCTSADHVVSSNANPYMASIEPVVNLCAMLLPTPRTP